MLMALKIPRAGIHFPESDGKPMADNTWQYKAITKTEGNLSILFADNELVFVAGNIFWYVAEEFPEIVAAPDVMVVFGRPKGDRASYNQWEEDGIAPQVVFEIIPGKTKYYVMEPRMNFYEKHGVEKCYVLLPTRNRVIVHIHEYGCFQRRRAERGFVSPRLGIRFDVSGKDTIIYDRDGRPFLSFEEIEAQRVQEQVRANVAEARAARLAELSSRLLSGQANEEQRQELMRLGELTSKSGISVALPIAETTG